MIEYLCRGGHMKLIKNTMISLLTVFMLLTSIGYGNLTVAEENDETIILDENEESTILQEDDDTVF